MWQMGWNLQPSLGLCCRGRLFFPVGVGVVGRRDPPGLHSGLTHPFCLSCSTRFVCKCLSPWLRHCFSWEVTPGFAASWLRAWKQGADGTQRPGKPIQCASGTPPSSAASLPWGHHVVSLGDGWGGEGLAAFPGWAMVGGPELRGLQGDARVCQELCADGRDPRERNGDGWQLSYFLGIEETHHDYRGCCRNWDLGSDKGK